MRDLVLRENRLDRVGIAQVALYKSDCRLLLGVHQPIQPAPVATLIEVNGFLATLQQVIQGPGADAAHASGNEIGIRHIYASTIRLANLPKPSTSTTYSSPGFIHTLGSMPEMTPSGVPVLMTSPGLSVITLLA